MGGSGNQVDEMYGDLRIFFEHDGVDFSLKFRKKGIQKSMSYLIGSGVDLEDLLAIFKAIQQVMDEGSTWVCIKCGEEIVQPVEPEECNNCGNLKFKAWRAHFKELTHPCGYLYVSLEEKNKEPRLILEKVSSSKIISYTDVLAEIDGLVEELKGIKETYQEANEPAEFDMPDIAEDDGHEDEIEEIVARMDAESVKIKEVLKIASKRGIPEDEAESAIESLKRDGEFFEPQQGKLQSI